MLACLTLILVILLQVGRGHGLSGASFSQSGVQTVFGTKTADFLTKATSVMAIVFVITCISLDILQARKSRSLFGPRRGPAAKIDMEKLKQVLAKIQAEQAKKAGAQGAPVAAGSPATSAAKKPAAAQLGPGQSAVASQAAPAVSAAPKAATAGPASTPPAPSGAPAKARASSTGTGTTQAKAGG